MTQKITIADIENANVVAARIHAVAGKKVAEDEHAPFLDHFYIDEDGDITVMLCDEQNNFLQIFVTLDELNTEGE